MELRVTRDEIFSLLTSTDGKMSFNEIRSQLGRGSFSTITRYVREWRALQEERVANIPDAPDEVQAAANKVASEIWAAASRHLDERVEAVNKSFDSEREEFERVITELSSAADDKWRDAENSRKNHLEAIELLKSSVAREKTLQEQLTGLGTGFTALTTELAEVKAKLEKANQELAALKNG